VGFFIIFVEMKKLLLVIFLLISVRLFSQSAGKSSGEKNSRSSARKPHAQMQHFDKRPKDKLLKRNGTSYLRRKRQKSKYRVDGSRY